MKNIPIFLLVLIFSTSICTLQAEDLSTESRASYNFKIKDFSAIEQRLKALEEDTIDKLDLSEKTKPVVVENTQPQTEAQIETVSLEDREAELLDALIVEEISKNPETPETEVVAKVTEPSELEIKLAEQEILIQELQASLEKTDNTEDLKKKLQKTQSQLLVAETEVERLSSILEDHNRKILGLNPVKKVTKTPPQTTHFKTIKKQLSPAQVSKVEVSADMPVITVSVDKANLRTGPGLSHSPLMEVAKGSRLVVEKREGEWLRVIAPNGNRAWVSSSVISFGHGSLSNDNPYQSPTRTAKVQGFDPVVEHERLTVF